MYELEYSGLKGGVLCIRDMKALSLVGHVIELYDRVRLLELPTDAVVNEFVRRRKYLGSKDRRFITDALFGIVRHRKRLEAILEHSLKQMNFVAPAVQFPALWMYVAYAICIRNQPQTDALKDLSSLWITSSPDVDLERLLALLNEHARLDFLPQFPALRLATEHSYPTWMVEQWLRRLGEEETHRLCIAMNEVAPVAIRVNTTKASVEECRAALEKEGVQCHPSSLSPFGLIFEKRVDVHVLRAFRAGLFEIQDEGSQILSLLVNPRPGELIVDACAGGGGKALHLSALMENGGQIVALDVDQRRLEELRRRCHRVNAANVEPVLVDAHDGSAEESYVAMADAVLVDAPCSGSGTIRRNPGTKWILTQRKIEEYQLRQRYILTRYSRLVKPGGRLVYATCSLLEEENEAVIQEFLEKQSSFRLQPVREVLEQWDLHYLTEMDYLFLFPHRHGTDGFFAAVLQRNP